jgi:Xaa-Pro aminopeptidase
MIIVLCLTLKKRTDITEYDGCEVLENFRRAAKHNMGLSFDTISCSGANAAIIHYHPEKGKSGIIKLDEIYLLDSGG